MFPGIGTAINVVAIIGGASLGILIGHRLAERTRNLLTDILGLVVLLGAASALKQMWEPTFIAALPQGWTLLTVLGSLVIGGLIGSALRFDARLDHLGENLRIKFKATKSMP